MKPKLFRCVVIEAAKLMNQSRDPIHDTTHTRRVVNHAVRLAQESQLTSAEEQALVIAAWWHDVARIITKNPSLVWMPMIDDILSGFMLLWFMLRNRLYDQTLFLAIRLLLGKSLGTGAFIKRIMLSKRNQFLADLLKDADTLDTFAIERCEQVLSLVDEALRYEIGYKIMCRWFTLLSHVKMKTAAARKYVIHLLHELLRWLKQTHIIAWHIAHFGVRWTKKSLARIERVVTRCTRHWQLSMA